MKVYRGQQIQLCHSLTRLWMKLCDQLCLRDTDPRADNKQDLGVMLKSLIWLELGINRHSSSICPVPILTELHPLYIL